MGSSIVTSSLGALHRYRLVLKGCVVRGRACSIGTRTMSRGGWVARGVCVLRLAAGTTSLARKAVILRQ